MDSRPVTCSVNGSSKMRIRSQCSLASWLKKACSPGRNSPREADQRQFINSNGSLCHFCHLLSQCHIWQCPIGKRPKAGMLVYREDSLVRYSIDIEQRSYW